MNDAKEMLDKYQYARQLIAENYPLLGRSKINALVAEKFGRGVGNAVISQMKDDYLLSLPEGMVNQWDGFNYKLRKAGYTKKESYQIVHMEGLWMEDPKKGFMFNAEKWRKLMSDKNKNMQGEEL